MRDDGEVLHTPADKHVGMLPREKFARTRGIHSALRPALWSESEAVESGQQPAPVFGAFPKRFVAFAAKLLLCSPSEVLHVCSGMLTAGDGGIRVDLRAAAQPTVRADGRALFIVPFPPPGCHMVTVRGVTTGCGYRIRALSVFERNQADLPGVA